MKQPIVVQTQEIHNFQGILHIHRVTHFNECCKISLKLSEVQSALYTFFTSTRVLYEKKGLIRRNISLH